MIVGFAFYVIGGWLFAFLYFLLFASLGLHTWWFGALARPSARPVPARRGLPLLPYIHPRMASEYDGASTLGSSSRPASWD